MNNIMQPPANVIMCGLKWRAAACSSAQEPRRGNHKQHQVRTTAITFMIRLAAMAIETTSITATYFRASGSM